MEAIDIIAELMKISAITAPKSKGEDFVQTQILKDDVLKDIADAMIAYGEKTGKKDFERDARNIAASEAVVLIGLKNATVLGLDCQACGFESCKALQEQQKTQGEFMGPICALRLLDMGIALGSAVKTASMHNVDNRIMYRVGVVARDMGLVNWDFVMGVPLSVTGKSIFFDR
jgi:uncharacterized ferredoxin-like protein